MQLTVVERGIFPGLLLFLVLLATLLLLPFTGSSAKPRPAENDTASLTIAGVERTYHVHLPPGFDKSRPAPLVLVLHGGGGNGRDFDRRATGGTLTRAADKRGMVLVFPDGLYNQWCDGRTAHLKAGRSCNDVAFLNRLIDVMQEKYGTDPRRVYVTGMSNGGIMALRLAVELADRIAAIAPVTASLPVALQDREPSAPVSLLLINGTDDPLVPWDGGHIRLFRLGRSRGEVLSTADTLERFRNFNGCAQTPESRSLPDSDPADGTRVDIVKYPGCHAGTDVILVKIRGGGHTWPGGTQYLGPWWIGRLSRDINASEMILDFFLSHSGQPRRK